MNTNLQTGQSPEEIICKYCCSKLSIVSGKKPFDRINEHLESARHKKLKIDSSNTSRQPTLEEMQVRQKELELQQEGVIFDFIHSLCLCGVSIYLADGAIG